MATAARVGTGLPMAATAQQADMSPRDLLALMNERDLRYGQRFDSQERAVTKALDAADKRFESVNEFRNQLKDQTGTFITRNEMWGWLVALIMMGFSAWNVLQGILRNRVPAQAPPR